MTFVITILIGCSEDKPSPEPPPSEPPVQPELPSEYDVTVTVEVPGTLSSQMPSSSFKTIKIEGELNGADIRYLRGIISSLTKIDLEDASIVSGGVPYYSTYQTEDGIIGEYMFSNIGGEFEIILPKNAIRIEKSAFEGSTGLIGIELPQVSYIGVNAFYQCKNLKGITIPESVTKIDAQAFYKCESLSNITLGSNIIEIGTSCFFECSSLAAIALPDKLTEIPASFLDGTAIEQIVIPSATETIGKGAFQRCTKLEKIILGENVKEIDPWAFNLSENIKEVMISESNPFITIDAGIIYTKDFKEIVLNVTSKVSELDIKDGIQRIRKEAFRNASPEKLTLPASLMEIEQSAFSYAVKEVHCKGVKPPKISWTVAIGPGHYAGVYAFQQATQTHASLFIPTGTTDQYVMAGYRVCFETITEE